jgi:nitrite reductase/ring-hydroxylating ferredoxin subunit
MVATALFAWPHHGLLSMIPAEDAVERRSFLKACAGALYSLLGAALAVPALRFLLGEGRTPRADRGFVRAVPLDSLSPSRPTRVTLQADRWDAYVHHPPGPIGGVWLSRDELGQGARCLQVICPHLGCGIEYSADRGAFYCPCHASEFDPAGRRRLGPSPRDMDELPCRITEPDEKGVRWIEVQYAEFQTGLPEKRPIA